MNLEPLKYYQHRYGGLYQVIDVSTSTVDKSEWVVYKHVFPFERKFWHRPLAEFIDGRFRELTQTEAMDLFKKGTEEFQKEITANKEAAKSKS